MRDSSRRKGSDREKDSRDQTDSYDCSVLYARSRDTKSSSEVNCLEASLEYRHCILYCLSM